MLASKRIIEVELLGSLLNSTSKFVKSPLYMDESAARLILTVSISLMATVPLFLSISRIIFLPGATILIAVPL